MERVLGSVLSTRDLSLAELCAARLDGELYPVGAGFSPVDEVPSPRQRALSLRELVPPTATVELSTAAWVYGARFAPPAKHTFCVDARHRVAVHRSPAFAVRERRLDEADLRRLGPVTLTSPLLTALDLLRREAFGPVDRAVVRRLLELAGRSSPDLVRLLSDRAPLPGNRRARRRLERWPDPDETKPDEQ